MSRQYNTSSYTNGPLLVEEFKKNGQISQEQTSFYITDTSGTSHCDFGAYDVSQIRNSDTSLIKWVKMPIPHLFWYAGVKAIKFGRNERTKYGFHAQIKFTKEEGNYLPGIFDTGTSLIYVPSKVSTDFFYRLLKNVYYTEQGSIYVVSCKDRHKFEDVFLMIDDHWLQIRHQDYVLELNGMCMLAFVNSASSYWLLGDAFLTGYYSIHDNIDH